MVCGFFLSTLGGEMTVWSVGLGSTLFCREDGRNNLRCSLVRVFEYRRSFLVYREIPARGLNLISRSQVSHQIYTSSELKKDVCFYPFHGASNLANLDAGHVSKITGQHCKKLD